MPFDVFWVFVQISQSLLLWQYDRGTWRAILLNIYQQKKDSTFLWGFHKYRVSWFYRHCTNLKELQIFLVLQQKESHRQHCTQEESKDSLRPFFERINENPKMSLLTTPSCFEIQWYFGAASRNFLFESMILAYETSNLSLISRFEVFSDKAIAFQMKSSAPVASSHSK